MEDTHLGPVNATAAWRLLVFKFSERAGHASTKRPILEHQVTQITGTLCQGSRSVTTVPPWSDTVRVTPPLVLMSSVTSLLLMFSPLSRITREPLDIDTGRFFLSSV